jgi:MoCo/4Fe-4S cofactor protein with predicted Tat translocation signal
MPSIENTDQPVWRSLDELEGLASSDKNAGDEFGGGADLLPDRPSRRHFMKLMAAGAGLAGLAGCRWPKEDILPYARRPPEIIPGNPIYFATSMDVAGQAQGLVVTSYDGRPIKVDGNPLHPNNRGGSDARMQASILDLYDPDRSKTPVELQGRDSLDQTWAEFDAFAREQVAAWRQTQGQGLCILAEACSSPSVRDMQARFGRMYPQARWYEYEPISRDNLRAGAAMAFGQSCRTHYRFHKAAVVVSLDSDFLATDACCLAYARDFIAAHSPGAEGTMSRLYVAESTYTGTGAMADNRLPAAHRDIAQVTCQLLIALAAEGLSGPALPATLVEAAQAQVKDATAPGWVQAAAKDLLAHRGRSVVLAGPRQPAEVHAVVHALNQALANVGTTVLYTADPDGDRPEHTKAIADLVARMSNKQVRTLLILGGNPVYNAPADLDFAVALQQVPMRMHLSLYWDETSQACTWHLPRSHCLEAWGDTQAYDGTYAPAQPLIRPLYDGRSVIELLSLLCETPALGGYEIVRRAVRAAHGPNLNDAQFEPFWRRMLNDGVLGGMGASADGTSGSRPANSAGMAPGASNSTGVMGEGLASVQPALRADAIAAAIGQTPARRPLVRGNLEIVFLQDRKVFDGRYANNGWLQELPDVFTKLTWDNAVLMAPETADELMLRHEQMVALSLDEQRRIVAPVYIMPGQAPFSLAVMLGYGRKAAGNVGNGVGVDAYPLRTTHAMHATDGVHVESTGKSFRFAMTQNQEKIDRVGRDGMKVRLEELVPDVTLAKYLARSQATPAAEPASPQLWEPFEYKGYRWGMAIDMQKCIGCNACTLACQAENNSPVVGRDQVQRHRQMQWLRIDRYFRGGSANPQISFQPIFCMHCENAPCESVCPVAATLHDKDGLNLMVYNRCVGTRYCSNNCPYKVRRFNFYHYSLNPPLVRQMQYNPDVTVRSRGVMEKCTYCIQRIQRAKIQAKNERRAIRDGEFTTACAQACPTGAIVFGDLNDPESVVARMHRHPRSYALLAELNTRPRSLHMARVRNPATTGEWPDETE